MCLRTPDDDITLTEGAGEMKVRHDFKDRLKTGDQTPKDNQRLQISVSPSSESVSLSRTTFTRCVGESGSDHSRTSRKAHSPPGAPPRLSGCEVRQRPTAGQRVCGT
ncbi:unnamed protein product [Arctogadus glacialis]